MPTRPLLHACLAAACLPAVAGVPAAAAEVPLVQARTVVADAALPRATLEAELLAARRYATFWNSGDPAFARAALAPGFMDRTLPPGRAQGVQGPLDASRFVRTAIPDLRAEAEQMIVAGDRVVVHLRFRGHFSGTWAGKQGQGQAVEFIATDIYRIADGRIAENWHIEDNLSLLKQLGLAGN